MRRLGERERIEEDAEEEEEEGERRGEMERGSSTRFDLTLNRAGCIVVGLSTLLSHWNEKKEGRCVCLRSYKYAGWERGKKERVVTRYCSVQCYGKIGRAESAEKKGVKSKERRKK